MAKQKIPIHVHKDMHKKIDISFASASAQFDPTLRFTLNYCHYESDTAKQRGFQ